MVVWLGEYNFHLSQMGKKNTEEKKTETIRADSLGAD